MVENLVECYGGAMQRRAPVASLGFIDEEGTNVASAFDAEGEFLFNFAWRPHKPAPHMNQYTEEGLFFC
jgi:hypothetical protein